MNSSVEFKWNPNEFYELLDVCNRDDGVQNSLRYLTDNSLKILEAGCGSGRVVKYLYDRGFRNVYGIELNNDAVVNINKQFPELDIIQGDLLKLPNDKNDFDRVLSYGVVEHFPNGMLDPLKSIYRILKPGGIAIITVPSMNFLRLLFPHSKESKRFKGFYPFPNMKNFFEYRLTPQAFVTQCKSVGFEIIESIPICHMDGVYHLFCRFLVCRLFASRILVRFSHWKFHPTYLGKLLNNSLSHFPFVHNHMHCCIVKK